MKYLRAVVVASFILGVGLEHAGAQESAKELFKKAAPSVVIVVSYDSAGEPTGLGSGFAVGKRIVATNYHVVEGAAKVRLFKSGTHTEIAVLGVQGVDRARDLALLKVQTDIEPLTLSEAKAEVGDTVYVIGNPQGLESTLSSGLVSGLRESKDPKLYQLTAPISPGSSGGPVMLANGKVIGVASASMGEGQNLNFAVQAGHLQTLIANSANDNLKPVGTVSGPIRNTGSSGGTVYVTDNGKTFHRADCRYLRKSRHPLSRGDAVRRGYTPCKVCNP